MELREVLPTDDVAARIGEELLSVEYSMRQIDEICALKTETMVDVGASIGYRLKLLDRGLDLQQFSEAFDNSDPRLFAEIEAVVGAPTLSDIHYSHIQLADLTADYRTVAELLICVCAPNVLHIGDLEFSNPRRPIAPQMRTRLMTVYKGLGLLGTLIDRCTAFAREKRLDAICLTPAADDIVPVFEALGFRLDDNDLADLMRQAGMPGPMSLEILNGL